MSAPVSAGPADGPSWRRSLPAGSPKSEKRIPESCQSSEIVQTAEPGSGDIMLLAKAKNLPHTPAAGVSALLHQVQP
jgi:hypothetical protein